MPADLEAVGVLAQMIGVVDHPGREPQHLLLERLQQREPIFRRALCPSGLQGGMIAHDELNTLLRPSGDTPGVVWSRSP